jgi:aminoglycoside 3-N-acetyltransferase
MRTKDLVEAWRASGLREGDTVLIHSDVRRTLRACLKRGLHVGPGDLLASFLEAVGPSGTLLLPLFNFDFTEGVRFDIRHTPSRMGALTEAGRQRPEAVRTGHPIYSFAAIGARARHFAGVDNFSGYGADSPFALLRELDGKIAVLDLADQSSMTFYHHVEEMLDVPYRYHKQFTGQYTDAGGETSTKTYGLFVRNIEQGVLTHVNPAGELAWARGLYCGSRPNENAGMRVVCAKALFDFVADIIQSGRAEGLLYRSDATA